MTMCMTVGACFVPQLGPQTMTESVGLGVGDRAVWCAVPR
jgi:hypothetical protein